MSDVKKTLPPSVGKSRGIGDILDSCGSELERVEQEARAACLRLAAGTADIHGVELWEKELGLDVRADLPLEARRTLIRIALEQMDTCTPEKLKVMLNQMLEGKAVLTERFAEYGVDLWVDVERFLLPSMRQRSSGSVVCTETFMGETFRSIIRCASRSERFVRVM